MLLHLTFTGVVVASDFHGRCCCIGLSRSLLLHRTFTVVVVASDIHGRCCCIGLSRALLLHRTFTAVVVASDFHGRCCCIGLSRPLLLHRIFTAVVVATDFHGRCCCIGLSRPLLLHRTFTAVVVASDFHGRCCCIGLSRPLLLHRVRLLQYSVYVVGDVTPIKSIHVLKIAYFINKQLSKHTTINYTSSHPSPNIIVTIFILILDLIGHHHPIISDWIKVIKHSIVFSKCVRKSLQTTIGVPLKYLPRKRSMIWYRGTYHICYIHEHATPVFGSFITNFS